MIVNYLSPIILLFGGIVIKIIYDLIMMVLAEFSNDITSIKNKKPMAKVAKSYYDNGDYNTAIGYYLIALNEKLPVSFINLGNCYFYLRKYKDAIECYLTAIKTKNNIPAAHFNLARCYQNEKNYKQAITNYLLAYKLGVNKINVNSVKTALCKLISSHKNECVRILSNISGLTFYSFYNEILTNREIKFIFNKQLKYVETECGVCYSTDNLKHTHCRHVVCDECLDKIIGTSCPYCRSCMYNIVEV